MNDYKPHIGPLERTPGGQLQVRLEPLLPTGTPIKRVQWDERELARIKALEKVAEAARALRRYQMHREYESLRSATYAQAVARGVQHDQTLDLQAALDSALKELELCK